MTIGVRSTSPSTPTEGRKGGQECPAPHVGPRVGPLPVLVQRIASTHSKTAGVSSNDGAALERRSQPTGKIAISSRSGWAAARRCHCHP